MEKEEIQTAVRQAFLQGYIRGWNDRNTGLRNERLSWNRFKSRYLNVQHPELFASEEVTDADGR